MTKTKSASKKFELIFKVSDIELATDEMKLWKDSTEYLEKTIAGKVNFSDMTKILQREIMKKDFRATGPTDLTPAKKVQIGLFYKCIITEPFEKFEEFIKLAQLLSDDGLNLFIEKFNYVVFSLPKLQPKYLNRLNGILSFLIKACPEKLGLTTT